eukprot:Phypoly_transcript_10330.p1 GENE.Phypoly_transcript_10330~~Phypoly_transcript_10330.p1  ORF type:complete len:419 (+),score=91.97 Phypoly_transcript_10330:43-1299(+)
MEGEWKSQLLYLPLELIWEIVAFLDPASFRLIEQTNHFFKNSIGPTYWKELCADLLNVDSSQLDDEATLTLQKMYKHISPLPTRLDQNLVAPGITIKDDGLSILFTGRPFSDQAVVGNLAYDSRLQKVARFIFKQNSDNKIEKKLFCSSLMYYELTIEGDRKMAEEDPFRASCIAIGLAWARFPIVGKQPGWTLGSYGYHSDDGRAFNPGRNFKYGPKFGPGDTVGCGWDFQKHAIFFTLNGENLGLAFDGVPRDSVLFPVIGIDTRARVSVNFGAQPFKLDVEAYTGAEFDMHDGDVLDEMNDLDDDDEEYFDETDDDYEEDDGDDAEDMHVVYTWNDQGNLQIDFGTEEEGEDQDEEEMDRDIGEGEEEEEDVDIDDEADEDDGFDDFDDVDGELDDENDESDDDEGGKKGSDNDK